MRITTIEDLEAVKLLVSLGKVRLSVYVFIIDGLLIDTGPIKKKDTFVALLNERKITDVILTHHHEDHTGMAKWVQENTNASIFIHESGIENCECSMKLPYYRSLSYGERKPFQATALGDTYTSENYTWDVIHTPGHADDHIALYNREKKWLFGGDLYIQSRPKSVYAFESIPTMIQSLQKILTYDFDTYICSHAGILLDGRRAIEKKLNYLLNIEEEVLLLHEKGRSPREIRKKLFPKNYAMNYITLFMNSPQHIVNSILK